ncbi:hypothetical protein KDW_10970 [Dictyobacter vulcani]|uniref:non-specific serine/threonine protein kinase n=1 Tax=Dictyobacter vulcani TaxID=2607529 RepID=A0A5J4KH66_9CHLR|nr:serine/threonine-protein kinase [Dictyobacter vulcani]GER86935.1 hypothetical protein KDW_10970 [Dictyobacter vulcani]
MKVNDDFSGTVLGNYTLEKIVGYGDWSTVYLARQLHPGRLVAVKVAQSHSPVDHDSSLKFPHTMTGLTQLDHPNIISLLDYDDCNQQAYLVLPYIGGGSLEHVLKRHGTLAPRQVLTYLLQIATALDYIHRQGIIHGNLKPANCLLYPDGHLVLTDFASMSMRPTSSGSDQAGEYVTTPLYMSPEMVQGELLTSSSDIYQLGILLFQLLSGHVPFKAESAYAIMRQHLQEPLPSIHALNPELPPVLTRVLLKATAKKCEERYHSAGELARAFALALAPATRSPQQSMHYIHPATPISTLVDLCPPDAISMSPSFAYLPGSTAELENKQLAESTPQIEESDLSIQPEWLFSFPSTISRKSHGIHSLLLKSMPFLVLVVIVALGFLHILGAFASPPLTPAAQARIVVDQFYADLHQQNYQGAYALCSPHFQKQVNYQRFINSYDHFQHSDIEFRQLVEHTSTDVDVILTVQVSSDKNMHYYYWEGSIDRQADGLWKIEQANFSG